jgi:hypothetical protein
VERLYAAVDMYIKECTFHANLNHHLDVFIYRGVDIREQLKIDFAAVVKRLKTMEVKTLELSEEGKLVYNDEEGVDSEDAD